MSKGRGGALRGLAVRKGEMSMETIQIVWAALIVIFLIVEAATAGLASIWFALGSVAALILAFMKPEAIVWQVVLFVVVSVITIVLTRPLAKKYVNGKIMPTNADRVIGKTAQVTGRIDNIAGTGEVSVDGRLWSARGDGEDTIEEGTLVTVRSISGVKLLVGVIEKNADTRNKEAVGA